LLWGFLQKKHWLILTKLGFSQRNGIEARKAGNGTKNTRGSNGEYQDFSNGNAGNVKKSFMDTGERTEMTGSFVAENARQFQEVYNLLVDKDRVYYANKILVGNCDAFCIGLKGVMYENKLELDIY
jgi:hypothetical protein